MQKQLQHKFFASMSQSLWRRHLVPTNISYFYIFFSLSQLLSSYTTDSLIISPRCPTSPKINSWNTLSLGNLCKVTKPFHPLVISWVLLFPSQFLTQPNKQTKTKNQQEQQQQKNTLFWMIRSFLKDIEAKNLSDKLQGMTYPFLEMKEGNNKDSYLLKYSCDHRNLLKCPVWFISQIWSKTKKPGPMGRQFWSRVLPLFIPVLNSISWALPFTCSWDPTPSTDPSVENPGASPDFWNYNSNNNNNNSEDDYNQLG